MKRVMMWLLWILGGLVLLVGLVVGIGYFVPVGHTASGSNLITASCETVWEALTDYSGQAGWRADITKIERVELGEGREGWREFHARGDFMTLETIEADPPRRLVRRIADEGLPFGGTWTWGLEPAEGGCTVTITENGEIYNPFFRFMARYVIGYEANLRGYLNALAARFETEGTP